jgi:hypothetical protein
LFGTASAALPQGNSMSNVINHDDITQDDNTDTDLSLTFTQIASCVIGAEFIEHRRQSLRAKLERESYERKKLQQQSFSNTFRNLFGLARNQG